MGPTQHLGVALPAPRHAGALLCRCVAQKLGSRDGPEPARRRPPGRRHPLARSGFIEYDRVIFFSDAVFAIAITLLAVNLRVANTGQVGSAHELNKAIPSILGFAISFAVIAFFWIGHHSMFRYITAVDWPLIALNLVFLGTIAFLPYPTDLLSASSLPAAVIFYAACCALAGLAQASLWVYATRSPVPTRGGDPPEPPANLTDESAGSVRTFYLLRILRVPAVFLLSVPVAAVEPRTAPYIWLLIWISGAMLNRFWRHPSSPEQVDRQPNDTPHSG